MTEAIQQQLKTFAQAREATFIRSLCWRPETTEVYDIVTHYRTNTREVFTLPQHFKQNGYHSEVDRQFIKPPDIVNLVIG